MHQFGTLTPLSLSRQCRRRHPPRNSKRLHSRLQWTHMRQDAGCCSFVLNQPWASRPRHMYINVTMTSKGENFRLHQTGCQSQVRSLFFSETGSRHCITLWSRVQAGLDRKTKDRPRDSAAVQPEKEILCALTGRVCDHCGERVTSYCTFVHIYYNTYKSIGIAECPKNIHNSGMWK
jgi:hypothetical protein